jgi:uncharacterized membrane protein YgaE (UPF0421/DUF939 family)
MIKDAPACCGAESEVPQMRGRKLLPTLPNLAADAWLLLQQALAATLAWLIATRVMQHHIPFFAPIAAVVALNTSLGQRGTNAVRLLIGVAVGIICGEGGLWLLGAGYLALGMATFVAMFLAQLVDRAFVVTAQAASAAILTVTTAGGEGGLDRLLDALVGAGVALVFSQVLFTPDPVRLVQRAEAAALGEMAEGLRLTAQGMRNRNAGLAARAVTKLRDLPVQLGELARIVRASAAVARHSLLWQRRRVAVTAETVHARRLDLLGGSCLLLARAATTADDSGRGELTEQAQKLADLLAALAADPADPLVQHSVRAGALQFAGQRDTSVAWPVTPDVALGAVAVDVLAFLGVDPLHPDPGHAQP